MTLMALLVAFPALTSGLLKNNTNISGKPLPGSTKGNVTNGLNFSLTSRKNTNVSDLSEKDLSQILKGNLTDGLSFSSTRTTSIKACFDFCRLRFPQGFSGAYCHLGDGCGCGMGGSYMVGQGSVNGCWPWCRPRGWGTWAHDGGVCYCLGQWVSSGLRCA